MFKAVSLNNPMNPAIKKEINIGVAFMSCLFCCAADDMNKSSFSVGYDYFFFNKNADFPECSESFYRKNRSEFLLS
jgi:hypothetical protein